MKFAKRRPSLFKKLLIALGIIPMTYALTYSLSDAAKAAYAGITLDKDAVQITDDSSSQERLKLRRKIQKHFINLGVYVPMEDIVFAKQNTKMNPRLNFLMQKACGKGTLYIWIPIRFKWPIIGEKVIDWCWKK